MKTLPVIAAFSHAMRSTGHNLGFAFRVSWPWMLALLPIQIAGNLYVVANSFGNPGEVDPKALIATIIMAIAGLIAFASIAVSWHRYILLDEIPRGMQRLRLDGTVWRYVGNILLIVLVIGLCSIPAGIAFAVAAALIGEAALYIIVPFIVVIMLAAVTASYRLSVKLPAVALGRRDYGISQAWTDTQGNFWRFLGLAFLYFLVAAVVGLLASGIGLALGLIGDIGLSIGIAVQLAVNWAFAILGVTMLTSLYGFFVEGRKF